MAKSLRSKRKMAVRAVRRHTLKADPITEKREQERFAKIQQTVEAGKAAREAANLARQAQREGEVPMDVSQAAPMNDQAEGAERMEIDPPQKALRTGGSLLTKKKKLKAKNKKKRSDNINTFHKKKGKGKKKGSKNK